MTNIKKLNKIYSIIKILNILLYNRSVNKINIIADDKLTSYDDNKERRWERGVHIIKT